MSNSVVADRPSAGAFLVIAAAAAFSTKSILIKLAYRHGVDAVTLLALRMGFALPFFLAMAWIGRNQVQPLLRRDGWALLGLGLIGYYLASLLDFLGLIYISAALERLILFLYPTMVLLISAWLFRRPVKPREWAALALSYGGIALVVLPEGFGHQPDLWLGVGLVFGSALAYAIYLVGGGRLIARVGSTRFTAYAMTVSCVAVLAQWTLTRPLSSLQQPWPVYGYGLTMALVATVLPAILLTEGIRRIGASRAALLGAIGPVSTIALGYCFLGENLNLLQILGSSLVVLGVLQVGK